MKRAAGGILRAARRASRAKSLETAPPPPAPQQPAPAGPRLSYAACTRRTLGRGLRRCTSHGEALPRPGSLGARDGPRSLQHGCPSNDEAGSPSYSSSEPAATSVQVVEGNSHVPHPVQIQAILPPPALHALGLRLPEPPNHILIALKRPALCLRQLEERMPIRSKWRDHQGLPHAGLDKQPPLLGAGRQGSKGHARACPSGAHVSQCLAVTV